MNFNALNTTPIGVIALAASGSEELVGVASISAVASCSANSARYSGAEASVISSVSTATVTNVIRVARATASLSCSADANTSGYRAVFTPADILGQAQASTVALIGTQSSIHVTADGAVVAVGSRAAYDSAALMGQSDAIANSYAQQYVDTQAIDGTAAITAEAVKHIRFIATVSCSATVAAEAYTEVVMLGQIQANAQVTEGTERLAIVEATVDSFAQISANSYAERIGEADVAGHGVTISVGHKVAVGFNSITAAANTTASSAVISSRVVSLEGAANLSSNSLVIRSAQAQTDALSTVSAHPYLICFGEAPIVSSASVSAEAYTVTVVVVVEPVAAALADASAYCDRLASASVSGNSVTISVGERQAISDTTISASAMVASTGINNAFTQANAQSLALVTADAGVGHAVSAAAHFMDYSVPIHVEEWRWIFEARWWRQYYNSAYSWNKNPWSGGNTSYPNFSDWPNVYSGVDHRVIDGPHYMTVYGTSYQYYKVETWVDYWETQYFWKGSPSANVTAIPSSVGFQLDAYVDPLTAAANVTAEPVRIRLAPTQPINCFAVAVADGQYEAVESADIVCSATVSENTGVIVSVVANVDDGGYWTADEYDWRSVSTNWQTEPVTGSASGNAPIYNGWEWFTSGYRLVLPHYTTSWQSNLGTLYHFNVEEYYLKTPSYFVVTDPSPSATVTAIAGQHAISWGEALLTDGYWETQTTWNEIPNAYYATYYSGNYAPHHQSWYYKDGTEVNYSGTENDLSVLPSGARVGTQLSVSGNYSTYHTFLSGGYTYYAPKYAVEEPTYTTVWVATGHNPSAEITANGSVLFVVEPFSVAATAAVSADAIKIAVVSNVDLPAIADVPPIADDKIVVTHIVHVDPFSVDCSSTVVASSANLITLSLDTITASAIVSVSAITLVSAVAEAIEEGYWTADEYDWRLLGSTEIVVTDQSSGYGNVVQGSQYANNPAEYRLVIPHYLVVGGVYHYYRVEEYYLKTPSYFIVTDPSPSAIVTAIADVSALYKGEALFTDGYWETQTTWNDIPNAYYATYASGHESLTNSWYYENNVEIGRSYTGGDISILPSGARVGTQLSVSGNTSTYHTFFSGGYTYYAPKYAVEEPTYTTVWVATDNRPYAEVTAGCFVIVGNKPVTLTGSAVTTASPKHMTNGGYVTLPATADVTIDDNKVTTHHIFRVEPFSIDCTCLVDEAASNHTTLSLDTISASAAPTASAYCLRATTAVASASASVYPDAFSHSEAAFIAEAVVSTNPHALRFTEFTVNATAEIALISALRLARSSADVIAACVVDAVGTIISAAVAEASAICQADTFVECFAQGYISAHCSVSGDHPCFVDAHANVSDSAYAQCFIDAQIHNLVTVTALPTRLKSVDGNCVASAQVHADTYCVRETQAELYCSADFWEGPTRNTAVAHDLVCTADFDATYYFKKYIFNSVINAASEVDISVVMSVQEGTRSNGIHILVEAEDRSVAVELINTALIIELEERVVYVEAA